MVLVTYDCIITETGLTVNTKVISLGAFMRVVPDGLGSVIASGSLRENVDKLIEETERGPVGVQQWGRPVCLVLVSREWWDNYLTSTDKGDDQNV